jgi:hypothetical protein
MHALLADLFPWVVAFYLLDGLAQPGRGHLLLVSGGRRFRALRAGLHLVGLSPLEEVVAVFDLPFLVAPGRVFLLDPRRRTEPAVIEAGELEGIPAAALAPVVREGRKVRVAGRLAVAAPGAPWAALLAARLRSGAPGEAGPGVRADLDAARALRARQRPFARALRVLSVATAAAVLVAWPAAAYSPLAASIPAGAVLGAVGALVALEAGVAFAMLRACGEPAGASAAAALHLLLPWAGAHAVVHVSRSLYRRLDALAVAAALLPPAAFHALAARELVRARFSRTATPAELGPAWDARARDLSALLEATGSSAARALAPPARLPGTGAWCPLCRAQYRAGFERCEDCGVEVERFQEAA